MVCFRGWCFTLSFKYPKGNYLWKILQEKWQCTQYNMKVKLPNNRKQEDGAKKSKSSDGLVQLYLLGVFRKLKPIVWDSRKDLPLRNTDRTLWCSASQPGALFTWGPQWEVNILLFFFFNLFIYLFIFGCVGSSLLRGLSLVVASGGYSSLRCAGFSLRWLLLLWSMGSRHVGLSSCGTQAQ